MGEVVITKSERVVLDIGLKLESGRIKARASLGGEDSFYGCTDGFTPTGKHLTESEWDKISYKKSTEEVCLELGISYKVNNIKNNKEEPMSKDKYTLSIVGMGDVQNLIASGLRNDYEVTVKPVYEVFWKQKIDHFDVTFNKVSKE